MDNERNKGGRGKTRYTAETLIGMYVSKKLTERQIAAVTGLSYGTVHSRLRAAHCPMRRRGRRAQHAG